MLVLRNFRLSLSQAVGVLATGGAGRFDEIDEKELEWRQTKIQADRALEVDAKLK